MKKGRVKTLLTFLFSFWHECGDLKWTGHNWGAEHDPDTSSCSPSAVVNNGKYLMYAYSVTGYDTNNDVSYSSARSLSDHDNTDILNSLLKMKRRCNFWGFLEASCMTGMPWIQWIQHRCDKHKILFWH